MDALSVLSVLVIFQLIIFIYVLKLLVLCHSVRLFYSNISRLGDLVSRQKRRGIN